MIVYHGSTLQIVHPDIAHSKRYLDFGRGFYVTSFQPQAEKWALRKGMRLSTTAVVNVYDFDMDAAGQSIRQFENENGAWLDFVCDCRRGNETEAYDIIAVSCPFRYQREHTGWIILIINIWLRI